MLLLRSSAKMVLNVSMALLMLAAPCAVARNQTPQKPKPPPPTPAKNPPAGKKDQDPTIAQIIKDVSPQRIQQTDEKLVSFGTRHTLSVNNPGAAGSPQGIVAARNWIKSEFERI